MLDRSSLRERKNSCILIHTFLGSDRRRHLKSLHLFITCIVPSPRATIPNICSVDMSYSFSEFMCRSNCRVLICVCNVSRFLLMSYLDPFRREF